MELKTYAKIMGLARTDSGFPAFGYVKLDGVKLQKLSAPPGAGRGRPCLEVYLPRLDGST